MSKGNKTSPNRASFVTGIDDLADFFPCQNQVSSRLVRHKNAQKTCSK
jgi:hypothetical protein